MKRIVRFDDDAVRFRLRATVYFNIDGAPDSARRFSPTPTLAEPGAMFSRQARLHFGALLQGATNRTPQEEPYVK